MESHGKPAGEAKGKLLPPEKQGNSYTASYLAAGESHAKGTEYTKIPSRKWGRWLLLLLVAAGVVGYARREELMPWLRKNSVTAPLVAGMEKQLGVAKPSKDAPAPPGVRSEAPAAAGGDVTFSSGKGFGTVTPDDGSDSFRVVVPPEQEQK